ncbi:hypothetical protein PAXINDRAFT_14616 [Paxillus involutus ATCC 200175]|uniref:Uncharacterized protein n=1 Tax=Paxillus involutus ATCC 200175 TaxID=664439 RepID=A0A0C9TZ09_PAXIN|nr:hypothetical protein PAXINDRAFT_14616 [Paxillus involutus ATCC 200175]
MNVEQWTSVLKLSTLWGFSTLRQAAFNRLSRSTTIPLAKKIALGYQYDVESWLLPTMNELVRRPEPITMEEAICMGFETALKLASVREKLALRSVSEDIKHRALKTGNARDKAHPYHLTPGPRADVRDLDFTPILRTTFNIPEIK